LIAVSKATGQVGLSVGLGHAVGERTVTVNFCNVMSKPVTPFPNETYDFVVVR